MAKVTYNGVVLAEADNSDIQLVEGNIYFPPETVNMQYFSDSSLTTVCPWKGTASYYTINVNGEELKDAAWYYPEAKKAAEKINGYVAFYSNKVQVER